MQPLQRRVRRHEIREAATIVDQVEESLEGIGRIGVKNGPGSKCHARPDAARKKEMGGSDRSLPEPQTRSDYRTTNVVIAEPLLSA